MHGEFERSAEVTLLDKERERLLAGNLRATAVGLAGALASVCLYVLLGGQSFWLSVVLFFMGWIVWYMFGWVVVQVQAERASKEG